MLTDSSSIADFWLVLHAVVLNLLGSISGNRGQSKLHIIYTVTPIKHRNKFEIYHVVHQMIQMEIIIK